MKRPHTETVVVLMGCRDHSCLDDAGHQQRYEMLPADPDSVCFQCAAFIQDANSCGLCELHSKYEHSVPKCA